MSLMYSEDALFLFFSTGKIERASNFFYSENRGDATGRLTIIRQFCVANRMQEPTLSRAVASAGEIINNCFDHNIGHWADKPGCCVSLDSNTDFIRIGIADRGRGIINSLRPVLGGQASLKQILKTAFEKIISGRTPERRGNGLKFVRAQIMANRYNALFCYSGGATYSIGVDPISSKNVPKKQDFGTVALLSWSKHGYSY